MRRLPLSLLLSVAVLVCILGAHPAGAAPDSAAVAPIQAVWERALTAEQLCDVEFLRHLGWRFEIDPSVRTLTVEGGQPARHDDLAAVHAAGGLRIRVPVGFDEAQARAAASILSALGDSLASRAAWRHKLVEPVKRATKRLSDMTEAGRHAFPEIFELFHSPVFRMDMPRTEWTLRDRMYFANRSSALAMEAFYRLGSTSECYVGQLLAIYGIQYELLGRDWFDHIFKPEELVVGRPKDVIKTPLLKLLEYEVPHEARALLLRDDQQNMDPIVALAPHGRIAFTGLAGVVLNQDESCFTQDNLVVVSVSQAALDQLVQAGGIGYFNREAARLWDCGNKGKTGLNVAGLFTIGGISDEAEKKMDEILDQPMFQEIQVYVHPDGIVPLAFTVKKFVTRTDTPVTLRINLNGLDYEFYRRYRAAFLEGCLTQRTSKGTAQGTAGTRTGTDAALR